MTEQEAQLSNYERKVEPRLQSEISRQESEGKSDPLDIIISFKENFQIPQEASREEKMRLSEEWALDYQRDIVDQIGLMGAEDVHQTLLFNLMNTNLTPEQIRILAENEKVNRFTWNKTEQVAIRRPTGSLNPVSDPDLNEVLRRRRLQ